MYIYIYTYTHTHKYAYKIFCFDKCHNHLTGGETLQKSKC